MRTQRAIVYYVRDPGPGFSPERLPHAAVSNPPDDPLAHTEKRVELGPAPRRLRPPDRAQGGRRVPAQREGQRGAADQAHPLAGAGLGSFRPCRHVARRTRAARLRSRAASRRRTAPRRRRARAARGSTLPKGSLSRPSSVPVATLCIFSTSGCQTPVAGEVTTCERSTKSGFSTRSRRGLEHPELGHHRQSARLPARATDGSSVSPMPPDSTVIAGLPRRTAVFEV